MANLGSENTPIEGESFGLPSGYAVDEENGDLVIRDTDGTVAMRRADGTWELESALALNENDISGVGAFDSDSVTTESAEFTGDGRNQLGPSDFEEINGIQFVETDNDLVDLLTDPPEGVETFYLEEGTHDAGSSLGNIDLEVNIIGAGKNRTKIESDPELIGFKGDYDGLVLRDFSVEGDFAAGDPFRLEGDDIYFANVGAINTSGEGGNGIRHQGDNAKIIGCTTVLQGNPDRAGLRLDGANECYIVGNDVSEEIRDDGDDNYPTPFEDHNNFKPEDSF